MEPKLWRSVRAPYPRHLSCCAGERLNIWRLSTVQFEAGNDGYVGDCVSSEVREDEIQASILRPTIGAVDRPFPLVPAPWPSRSNSRLARREGGLEAVGRPYDE